MAAAARPSWRDRLLQVKIGEEATGALLPRPAFAPPVVKEEPVATPQAATAVRGLNHLIANGKATDVSLPLPALSRAAVQEEPVAVDLSGREAEGLTGAKADAKSEASPPEPTTRWARWAASRSSIPGALFGDDASDAATLASSDGECSGEEREALEGVSCVEAGPWKIGGLEFFSAFETGNCAGVSASPPGIYAPEAPPEEKKPADVEWAAEEREDGRLMYKVMVPRLCARMEPRAEAKMATRKSTGARFIAYNRQTLDGWQKLVGENGWVLTSERGPDGMLVDLAKQERAPEQEVQRYAGPADATAAAPAGRAAPGPGDVVRVAGMGEAGEGALGEVLEEAEEGRFRVRLLAGSEVLLLAPERLAKEGDEAAEEPQSASAKSLPRDQAEEQDLCFDVAARSDGEGASRAKGDCQWFHFGLRGEVSPGRRLRFRILGLSRFRKLESAGAVKGRLLTDGLLPVFRLGSRNLGVGSWGGAEGGWSFVTGAYGVQQNADGSLAFTFEHVLGNGLKLGQELFFALTFPYTLSRAYAYTKAARCRLAASGAYARRERLAKSLGGHRVELLTASRRRGAARERQPPLEGLDPPQSRRPREFPGRSTVFISARVHPGETPASYMLEGLLDFLSSGSPAADELLRRYVFQIIPVLNPDGVALGHHRNDLRGENLNRVYGSANLVDHPSVVAAEAVCRAAHERPEGLRLYLDLHAHSNRRGAFLLGDADLLPPAESAAARLYGYALCRRCAAFEYSQSDFGHSVEGTGKSGIRALTGEPLCFTVETHYIRGHHSFDAFEPSHWRSFGRGCLEALLDLDRLESPSLSPSLRGDELAALEDRLSDLNWARLWLELEEPSTLEPLRQGPSRLRPHFGVVRTATERHTPSAVVWRNSELLGKSVEIIERRTAELDGQPGALLRLHECDGGHWLPESDVQPAQSQKGRFFYGALCAVGISKEPSPGSVETRALPPGTVLEVSERRVVDGHLRLRVVADSLLGGGEEGWASEHRGANFDPKLGGQVQLMRVRGPPSGGHSRGRPRYAFPR